MALAAPDMVKAARMNQLDAGVFGDFTSAWRRMSDDVKPEAARLN